MPANRDRASPRRPAATAIPTPRAGTDASDAITRLVDLYGPRLHGLAHRLCGRSADADDLVQDVFLQAFRKWHTFRGESDPGTWLYTIAARACKARRRRARTAPTPSLSLVMPWNETTISRFAADTREHASVPERKEAIEHVQAAIARLPEHLRLPLVLKEVLELPVEDVASALGLAANTIKTRLHRARLALRKAMTQRTAVVPAPDPIYEKQVCLDLLKAKMDAMDRGGPPGHFKVPQAQVCARCRAVFRELDLVQDACAHIQSGDLPPALRAAILKAIRQRDAAERSAAPSPRRGRRPVNTSAAPSRR